MLLSSCNLERNGDRAEHVQLHGVVCSDVGQLHTHMPLLQQSVANKHAGRMSPCDPQVLTPPPHAPCACCSEHSVASSTKGGPPAKAVYDCAWRCDMPLTADGMRMELALELDVQVGFRAQGSYEV